MTEQPTRWIEPLAGFEFEPDTIEVSREFQQEKLIACGLDPSVFDDSVDPSFFIGIGIHAGIRNGISAEGNVNMLTRLIQHRPVASGEPLIVRGVIRKVTEVPRGQTIETEVWFEDEAGRPVISAPRKSLKPDPSRSGRRGAGERPPPVIANTGSLLRRGEYRLTPDQVRDYSSEGNSIHYEMEAANRAGFRAPIIGGGMGVHFLMSALWLTYRPESFDLSIYFRRPIFWDDTFTVAVDASTEPWGAIGLIRDGKVLTEAAIAWS